MVAGSLSGQLPIVRLGCIFLLRLLPFLEPIFLFFVCPVVPNIFGSGLLDFVWYSETFISTWVFEPSSFLVANFSGSDDSFTEFNASVLAWKSWLFAPGVSLCGTFERHISSRVEEWMVWALLGQLLWETRGRFLFFPTLFTSLNALFLCVYREWGHFTPLDSWSEKSKTSSLASFLREERLR